METFIMNAFSSFNVREFVTLTMGMILFCTLIFFIVMSIILEYHWSKYGLNQKVMQEARLIYFVISIFFFLAMGVIMILRF